MIAQPFVVDMSTEAVGRARSAVNVQKHGIVVAVAVDINPLFDAAQLHLLFEADAVACDDFLVLNLSREMCLVQNQSDDENVEQYEGAQTGPFQYSFHSKPLFRIQKGRP